MLNQHTRPDSGDLQPQIVHLVRAVSNQVYDPCSMAMGVNVGLDEMGLVRDITAEPGPNGWNVRLRLRLTSPGCQYFFYFKEELEERLLAYECVSTVRVDWDERFDWTPDDFSETARGKISAGRTLLHRPRVKRGQQPLEELAGA